MYTSNINKNSSSSNINNGSSNANSSILHKKRKHIPTKFYHNSDYCKGKSSNKKIKKLSKSKISIAKSTCNSSDDSSKSSSVVLLPPLKKEIAVVDLCGPDVDESSNNESSSSNDRIMQCSSSSSQQQDEYRSPVGIFHLVSERQLFLDGQRRDAHQQSNDMHSQYQIDNSCEYDNEEYVSPYRSPEYPSAENYSNHDEENLPLEPISQVDKVENNVNPLVQEEQKNLQQENPVFRTYSNYFYR